MLILGIRHLINYNKFYFIFYLIKKKNFKKNFFKKRFFPYLVGQTVVGRKKIIKKNHRKKILFFFWRFVQIMTSSMHTVSYKQQQQKNRKPKS